MTLPRRDEQAYAEFQSARYFPQLDGLRAVSILLVLAVHMRDSIWTYVNGHLGVTLFFIISGFLITTLLLREEQSGGRVSLRAFYVRRTFRIFPLYYLALATFTTLVFLRFGDNAGNYPARLPYFLTYLNELAGAGTFGHSWSLGVEEKYYLVWPVLAFAAPMVGRYRPLIAVALLGVCTAAGLIGPVAYLGQYAPILAGVVLALALHDPRAFRVVAIGAQLRWAVPLLAVAAAGFVLDGPPDDHIAVIFAFTAPLVFPVLLLGPRRARGWLESRPMRFIGQRSYAVYLFHPIVLSAVDRMIPSQSDTPIVVQVVRFLVTVMVSLLVADVLYRSFERPMIRVGRVVAARVNPGRRRGSRDAQAGAITVTVPDEPRNFNAPAST